LLSAEAGAPAALRVAASFAWSQPSTFWSPIDVTTAPAGPSIDLNDRPCLVRKSLTRSQSENLLHGPTKMWSKFSDCDRELAPRADEDVELALARVRLDRDRRLGRELLERRVHVVREARKEREVRDRGDQAAGHD